MSQTEEDKRIDDLINHIDEFMAKGGGRMNVSGGEGAPKETYCHTCCGEFSDNKCVTPADKKE